MPIQLDAIDMVISKQGFFSAVRFFMVPPTKGYRVQPDMDDSFSISTHAHAVNMVHLCRLVANCTPAIFKAEIQVLANIVRLGEQAVLCGHSPMEAKLNQVCNKLSGRGHIAIREGEPLPQAAGAEIPFQIKPKFFRLLP